MNLTLLINNINKHIDLTEEEINLLRNYIIERKYLKGQFIVQQGDICKFESFIINGCTKTFFVDSSGNEHIVLFAIENWWAGDLGSFVKKTPAKYNVQCLEPTTVLQFSYHNLELLYENIPKFERFFRLIIQNGYINLQNRITNNFSLPAKERYLLFKKQYPAIEQRVPQYLIASYLGITKQFLSKIRSEILLE